MGRVLSIGNVLGAFLVGLATHAAFSERARMGGWEPAFFVLVGVSLAAFCVCAAVFAGPDSEENG